MLQSIGTVSVDNDDSDQIPTPPAAPNITDVISTPHTLHHDTFEPIPLVYEDSTDTNTDIHPQTSANIHVTPNSPLMYHVCQAVLAKHQHVSMNMSCTGALSVTIIYNHNSYIKTNMKTNEKKKKKKKTW